VKSKNGALIPFRMGESWQNAVFLEAKSKKQGYFGFRLPDHPAGSQRSSLFVAVAASNLPDLSPFYGKTMKWRQNHCFCRHLK